jgi:hypothetical protein
MAKCPKCSQRKAKRFCPALGYSICSLCCGRLREKEIDCPPTCRFLEKHKSYQEKRQIEEKTDSYPSPLSPSEDILQDERMAWLAFHIEASLKAIADRDASFSDRDALLALVYAQRNTERKKSIIVLNGRNRTEAINESGEIIIQSMDRCRYEKKIFLPDEHLGYSNEEKVKCLERIILSVRSFAKGRLAEKRYIQALQERFARIKNLSRSDTLVSLK